MDDDLREFLKQAGAEKYESEFVEKLGVTQLANLDHLESGDLDELGLAKVPRRGLERALQESGEREVTSDLIGRRVLEELRDIDALAAVRFASVFRDFSSPRDYEAFFEEIEGDDRGDDEGDGPSEPGGAEVRPLRAGR